MATKTLVLEAPKPSNGFRDSAFTKNRYLPLHRWVPWIAGFSADFVDDCLRKYLPVRKSRKAWVLDPFSGVGTTLLQGYLNGYDVVGFEINPYAALASKVKLEAASVSVAEMERHIGAYERFMQAKCPDYGNCKGKPQAKPPEGFRGRTQLFSPQIETRVLTTVDFIERISDPLIPDAACSGGQTGGR